MNGEPTRLRLGRKETRSWAACTLLLAGCGPRYAQATSSAPLDIGGNSVSSRLPLLGPPPRRRRAASFLVDFSTHKATRSLLPTPRPEEHRHCLDLANHRSSPPTLFSTKSGPPIIQSPHSGSFPAPSSPVQEIFSRIRTRSNHRATHTPLSYHLVFQHKDFVCWKRKFRNISTNSPMRPNNLLEDQETVPAEGNRNCTPNVQATPEIEKKYVHRVYDAIAPHFSSTRFAKWPKVAGFLNSLTKGSIVLDAGCGNGKYLGFNPDCFFIGCDISPPLIEICAGKGHDVLVADAVNLPYRDNFGDAAISIAVLHHLSTVDRRRKAIEELVRVVRRGGLVLITVWAREQEDKSLLNKWTPLSEKYNEEWVDGTSPPVRSQSTTSLESIAENDEDTGVVKQTGDLLNKKCDGREDKTTIDCNDSSINGIDRTQQEYFVPWHLPFHRAEIGGVSAAAVENGFAKKDDKKGAVVYSRYYHVFVEGELQRLVAGINNAAIVDQFYDKSNWCIVLEKL